jgi:hypothetical protein
MFLNTFFDTAKKSVCDLNARGALYGCAEVSFSVAIVMVVGLLLGIIGEARFDEKNSEEFVSGTLDSETDGLTDSGGGKGNSEPGVPGTGKI